jgi:hypothetical protein
MQDLHNPKTFITKINVSHPLFIGVAFITTDWLQGNFQRCERLFYCVKTLEARLKTEMETGDWRQQTGKNL